MFPLMLPGSLTQLCPGTRGRVRVGCVNGSFLKIGIMCLAQDIPAQARSSSSSEESGPWRKDRGLPWPPLEGRKEGREDWGSLNPRDGHLSIQTHLFPCAHPKADAAHTARQAVRHAAGAKARSMSLQLPAGDKPRSRAGLGLDCPERPPGTSPGLPRGSLCKA